MKCKNCIEWHSINELYRIRMNMKKIGLCRYDKDNNTEIITSAEQHCLYEKNNREKVKDDCIQ